MKLGLETFNPETDQPLFDELEQVLALTETDMTIFYRRLALLTPDAHHDGEEMLSVLLDCYYQPESLTGNIRSQIQAWLKKYLARVAADSRPAALRQQSMNAVNPLYVPRNYLAQMAIDEAEKGDPGALIELQEVLRRPYDEQPGRESYAARRPDWARTRVGCSQLSCSS
jgi:uncharacterized protein YdiU (UPF0061 family)